jgi:N,N'-diacetyllegionaminate synthase
MDPRPPLTRKLFWDEHRAFIIAEVAQTHDGSLGLAHAFIDSAAAAGADAVKFQTHIADAESTPSEPWRVKFSPKDETRYEYWKRMEFSESEWLGLKQHADDLGIVFLSSPFSHQAVDLLERIGVPGWKIPSGEIGNLPLIEHCTRTGKPIILSSGLSSFDELDAAVNLVKEKGNPLAVLQCTSTYPCPPEKIGINLIPEFRHRYKTHVGLSDHSGTIYPALAAMALGASIVEVHFTMSRQMYGPDVSSSVTTEELLQIAEASRFYNKMFGSPIDKDKVAREMAPVHKIFSKSLVAAVDIVEGSILRREHLTAKKPGGGIPPSRLADVIGLRITKDVKKDEPILDTDLEFPTGHLPTVS